MDEFRKITRIYNNGGTIQGNKQISSGIDLTKKLGINFLENRDQFSNNALTRLIYNQRWDIIEDLLARCDFSDKAVTEATLSSKTRAGDNILNAMVKFSAIMHPILQDYILNLYEGHKESLKDFEPIPEIFELDPERFQRVSKLFSEEQIEKLAQDVASRSKEEVRKSIISRSLHPELLTGDNLYYDTNCVFGNPISIHESGRIKELQDNGLAIQFRDNRGVIESKEVVKLSGVTTEGIIPNEALKQAILQDKDKIIEIFDISNAKKNGKIRELKDTIKENNNNGREMKSILKRSTQNQETNLQQVQERKPSATVSGAFTDSGQEVCRIP